MTTDQVTQRWNEGLRLAVQIERMFYKELENPNRSDETMVRIDSALTMIRQACQQLGTVLEQMEKQADPTR